MECYKSMTAESRDFRDKFLIRNWHPLSFQSQQILCVRDAKGTVMEGDPDKVMKVTYVWVLCRDQTELDPKAAWRLLELSAQSQEQFLWCHHSNSDVIAKLLLRATIHSVQAGLFTSPANPGPLCCWNLMKSVGRILASPDKKVIVISNSWKIYS